jgi:hypothetical protein
MSAVTTDPKVWQSVFLDRARPLTRRWRRQRLGARALATLWLPVGAMLVLLLLQRWTLVELPEGAAAILVPPLLWAAALGVWWLLDRPPVGRLAHITDTALGLDERLSTAYELAQQPFPANPSAAALVQRQRDDALFVLHNHAERMTAAFPLVPGHYLKPLAVAAGLSLLMVPAMFLPSPVEPLRAQRAALRAAVLDQADLLDGTRREAVARPDLPPALSTLLDQELATATDRLRNAPTDRGSAVAALSQAEDRLRKELPDDYQGRTAARLSAARDVQAALPGDFRTDDPALAQADDLQKAAANAETLADAVAELLGNPSTVNDVFVAAGSLERAATSLSKTDPAAAAQLRAAAAALRKGDAPAAQDALKAAAAGLRQASADQVATDTLAGVISQLSQSRVTVAQAGLDAATAANNPQDRLRGVGRPSQGGTTPPGADGAGANAAPGGGQAAQPGQGPQGGPGSGPSQPGQGGSAAGAQAGSQGAGAVNTGGNSAGTQNGSGNDSGQGAGAAPNPTGSNDPSGPERVFVPETGAAPTGNSNGPQDTIPLDSGGGATADNANSVVRTGPGLKPGVHTPYENVIGQYGESAASALDRSALPPDAKQYVRDYFSSLEP